MMEVSGKKKIKPEPSNEDFYEDKVFASTYDSINLIFLCLLRKVVAYVFNMFSFLQTLLRLVLQISFRYGEDPQAKSY